MTAIDESTIPLPMLMKILIYIERKESSAFLSLQDYESHWRETWIRAQTYWNNSLKPTAKEPVPQ